MGKLFSWELQNNKKKTEKLFEFLTELGNNKGYKVYSHSLSKEFIECNNGIFVNREWLFDLCWYIEKGHGYLLKSLDLAVEAEWSNKRKEDKDQYGGVKYDFQKTVSCKYGIMPNGISSNKRRAREIIRVFWRSM